jgi:hypothetical protein
MLLPMPRVETRGVGISTSNTLGPADLEAQH